jgi:hypothetical protein
LRIIKGSLPPRAYGLVVEWASIHKKELEKNWQSAVNLHKLNKIKPLN